VCCMGNDKDGAEVEQNIHTVIRWDGTDGQQHRIQTYQLPGSAHWAIVKDTRSPGGSWSRHWGTEARHKPDFENGIDLIPTDTTSITHE